MKTARRLTGEFAVIVFGVLVAIGADRWNQDRLEHRLAVDYSARLLAELAADSVRLTQHSQDSATRSSACVSLLEVVRGNEPDSTARGLYFAATGAPPPYPGGATFNEVQNTGSLRLLPEGVPQILFDYYGYVDGTLERIENVRRTGRSAMVEAANRSGVLMPREISSLYDFTERLRSYPDIVGIVMGCVAYQSSEVGLIDRFWMPHLSETLATLRASRPEGERSENRP